MSGEPRPRRVADKLVDALLAKETSVEEALAASGLKSPELQLAMNTPTLTVDETSHLKDVLPKVREDDDILALRERDSSPSAVVIPVKRYLELVGIQLASNDPRVDRVAENGLIAPTSEALAARHVEQVDPTAKW